MVPEIPHYYKKRNRSPLACVCVREARSRLKEGRKTESNESREKNKVKAVLWGENIWRGGEGGYLEVVPEC